MSRIKALLLASALATGPAFAGQDSTLHGSAETSPPEMLSEQYLEPMSEEREWMSLREEEELMRLEEQERMAALEEEGEVVYIIPMEVTEYYLLVPVDPRDVAG